MFTIRFDWPDGAEPSYAGIHKGAMGWAPTLATAKFWDDEESAQRWLDNGFGAAKTYGVVIEADKP